MSEKTTTKPLGTINGKEYVETKTEYAHRIPSGWTDSYVTTGYDCNNGICWKSDRNHNTGNAYDASCSLLRIIAELEKNLTEHMLALDQKLTAKISAVDEKLDEHIQDDIFTAMLKKHKQEAAQLQKKLESAEANNKELTAQLAQVTEERNKLQEWKARMQKQFE